MWHIKALLIQYNRINNTVYSVTNKKTIENDDNYAKVPYNINSTVYSVTSKKKTIENDDNYDKVPYNELYRNQSILCEINVFVLIYTIV